MRVWVKPAVLIRERPAGRETKTPMQYTSVSSRSLLLGSQRHYHVGPLTRHAARAAGRVTRERGSVREPGRMRHQAKRGGQKFRISDGMWDRYVELAFERKFHITVPHSIRYSELLSSSLRLMSHTPRLSHAPSFARHSPCGPSRVPRQGSYVIVPLTAE